VVLCRRWGNGYGFPVGVGDLVWSVGESPVLLRCPNAFLSNDTNVVGSSFPVWILLDYSSYFLLSLGVFFGFRGPESSVIILVIVIMYSDGLVLVRP